jgi:hypothetical protein
MQYIELLNDQIIKKHNSLPSAYRNISNFFALSPEQLSDLSWSGNSGVKFYPYIENKPEVPEGFKLSEPEYVIDEEQKTVTGNYELVELPPPPPPPQAETISARQIRLWLVRNGISLQSIEDAINQIPDEAVKESLLIEWQYAAYVDRNHPMILELASMLGLNEEQLNNAFNEASLI